MPDSRFKTGQEVRFQPDMSKIDGRSGTTKDGVKAKVVDVTFRDGKVLYDLAVWGDGAFYEALPIRQVDSYFVCPL